MKQKFRVVNHKEYAERDLVLVFEPIDLETSKNAREALQGELLYQLRGLSISLSNLKIPMSIDFYMFNFQHVHFMSAVTHISKATDIIMEFLYQRYMELKKAYKDYPTFDDFLENYLLTGGVRVRMAFGRKVKPNMFDPNQTVTLETVINLVKDMRDVKSI